MKKMPYIFVGLMDGKRNLPEQRGEETPRSYTTVTDAVLETEYDRIVSRLVTPTIAFSRGKKATSAWGLRALWDTGSITTCISGELARRLDLTQIDTMTCITPSGQIEAPMYYIDLAVAEDIRIDNLKVVQYPLERHEVDMLIGMDVISKGKLVVESVDGRTKIRFQTRDD